MSDPGAGIAQEIHLHRIDVDRMGDDAPRAQDAGQGQPVDGSLAVLMKRVVFVGLMFGHVDMESCLQAGGRLDALDQGLFG